MAPSTLAELVAQMSDDSDREEDAATLLQVAGATSDDSTDWRDQLRTQQWIDVLDWDKQWREAVVEAVHRHKVQVRYRGWERKWDEWIPRRSDRLSPAYSRVPPWRERLAVGTPVQVGLAINGFKHAVWRDGHVDAVSESSASESNEKQRRVRVVVGGEGRWLDRSDDMLAPPGTHDVPPKNRASSSISSTKQKPTATRATTAREESDADYRIPGRPLEAQEAKKRKKKKLTTSRRFGQAAGDDDGNSVENGDAHSSDDDGAPGELLWRAELAEESLLEACDEARTVWYDARIVETRRNVVRVRFRGWPWRYDEWVKRASDRLAPVGTHLGPWREFQMQTQVQVGILGRRASDTATQWKIATVVGLRRKVHSKTCVGVKLQVDGETFWRDAHDDFLAPLGHPTYPPCDEEALAATGETKLENCAESPPPRNAVTTVLNLASAPLDGEAAVSISDEPSSTASTDVALALDDAPDEEGEDDTSSHHEDGSPTVDRTEGHAGDGKGSIAAAEALVHTVKAMLERATREIMSSIETSVQTIRDSIASASTSTSAAAAVAASPPPRPRKRAATTRLQTNSKRRIQTNASMSNSSRRSRSNSETNLNDAKDDLGRDSNVSLI